MEEQNNSKLIITWGTRIWVINTTWPLARLSVSKDNLVINSLWKNYSFIIDDIISIEPYSSFISAGIKINHKVSWYSDLFIFWTWIKYSYAQDVVEEIKKIGFVKK